MVHGTKQVQQSVEYANKAGGSLEKITASVTNMLGMNSQVADAASRHAQVSTNVNNSMRDISNAVTEAADNVKQISTSSHEVAEMAGRLQELVGHFKY